MKIDSLVVNGVILEEEQINLLENYLRPLVRECAFDECGRIFVIEKNSRGGPKRKYCCHDHCVDANKKTKPVRDRKYRERKRLLNAALGVVKR